MRAAASTLLAAALALLGAAAAAATPGLEVEAGLVPEVIGVEETAQLSIEVRSEGFARIRFRPSFELDNLEIAGGPFELDESRFVNGRFSRAVRMTWELRPLAPGPARVRSLKVLVRGTVLDLAGAEILVRQEPSGPAAARPRPRDSWSRFFDPAPWMRMFERRPTRPRVFLRAEVTPRSPYVGEQALYTVYLYTRDDVHAINPRSMPAFQGLWVRDLPVPSGLRVQMVEVDGESIGRVPLLRKALFPLRPGPHEIEPTEMELLVRPYDGVFSMGAEREAQEVQVSSQRLRVDVRPLPPVPPGLQGRLAGRFEGIVGHDLDLKAWLEPEAVRLGEASTLTVTLDGEGNLQGVAAPAVAGPEGLDLLPPEHEMEDAPAGDAKVWGRSTWSFAVVPERTGTFSLAVPEIPYFDPVAGAYRVAQAPPLALAVRGRAPGMAETPGQLHGIRSMAVAPPREWGAALLWAFVLPWGIALGAVLLRRRQSSGPAAAPSRVPAPPAVKAASAAGAEARLHDRLRAAAAEPRPRQAAAALEDAWRRFLAERWAVPTATPAARWPGMLEASGRLSEAALRELSRLVDDLHYLRGAPELSAVGPLRDEAMERSRRLLRQLR